LACELFSVWSAEVSLAVGTELVSAAANESEQLTLHLLEEAPSQGA